MKRQKILIRVLNFFLIGILIGGCTFPVTTSDEFDVFFGRPSRGDVIMVGETFDLLANGVSTAGDVSRVLYFANGRLIGEAPNRASSTIVASFRWTPSEAGQYTLQLAAQRGSEYAYSSTITVCVLPFQIAPDHPFDIYAHGYDGNCIIPERSITGTSGPIVVTTASSSPQSITYVPDFFSRCLDQTRIINFKFYLEDPNDDIVFATIDLRMNPSLGGRINGETTLALTRIGGSSPISKLFAGSMDMHIYFTRSLTNPTTGEGLSGDLIWRARAFNRSGEIILEEGPFTIPVTPTLCDGAAPTASMPPTETPAVEIEPQFTSTPASAIDCPPGTYYSDITNKCYQIAIPTATKKGNDGDNVNVCSQYDSANTCIAGGCTYNYNTKSCE